MKYNIADLVVEMETFGRTWKQAQPYRCSLDAEADVKIDTQKYTERIMECYPEINEDSCEYMATSGSFYWNLLRHNGFMLHSSAVVADGAAYLFTADSGTGKSTHTELWMKIFGDSAYILNDDKPAMRKVAGKWYAYGTPWSGKNDISTNASAPVKGIAILERGQKNEITRLSGMEAIMKIMRQCNRPRDPESRMLLMDLLDSLLKEVPVWKLRCNMDPEAAIVAYEAMSGEKWRK